MPRTDNRRHPLRELHRQHQRHELVRSGLDPDRPPEVCRRIDPVRRGD